jgi:hypothetical protein
MCFGGAVSGLMFGVVSSGVETARLKSCEYGRVWNRTTEIVLGRESGVVESTFAVCLYLKIRPYGCRG